MLVQSRDDFKVTMIGSPSKNLDEMAFAITQAYSQRSKAKQTYFFVELDQSLGFKLQFKFSKNQSTVRGTLTHNNGKPVHIPESYRNCLLNKLQKTLRIPARFFFYNQIDSLIFHLRMNIGNNTADSGEILKSQLKNLISSFSQINNIFVLFGITKRLNIYHKNLVMKRMQILSKIIEILKNKTQLKSQGQDPSKKLASKQEKGSVFRYYSKIQETQMKNFTQKSSSVICSSQVPSIKKGGYFQVERKICKVTGPKNAQNKSQTSLCDLAIKTLRKDQENVPFCKNKIEKQIKILHQIVDPKHSLTYFVKCPQPFLPAPESENKLCMEYIEETLDDYIYGDECNFLIAINYIHQIVRGVNILQKSGIVHRDLKPQNVLVKFKKDENNRKSRHIKIIDFGQSSLSRDSFSSYNLSQENLLGATLPYSPLECYLTCQEGYNSKQIDLWSVGLISYQLFYKKNPLFYSRCFAGDINRGWRIPDEFSIFPNLHKKNGIQFISLIFSMLTLNSVCISQQQRISLQKMQKIIIEVENFLSEEKLY